MSRIPDALAFILIITAFGAAVALLFVIVHALGGQDAVSFAIILFIMLAFYFSKREPQ